MHLLSDLGTAAALWGSAGLLLPPFLLARLKGVSKFTFSRGPCVASVVHPGCSRGLPKSEVTTVAKNSRLRSALL